MEAANQCHAVTPILILQLPDSTNAQNWKATEKQKGKPKPK